jgi:fructose-specific component phosphotransferase system IIB-like protein
MFGGKKVVVGEDVDDRVNNEISSAAEAIQHAGPWKRAVTTAGDQSLASSMR